MQYDRLVSRAQVSKGSGQVGSGEVSVLVREQSMYLVLGSRCSVYTVRI